MYQFSRLPWFPRLILRYIPYITVKVHICHFSYKRAGLLERPGTMEYCDARKTGEKAGGVAKNRKVRQLSMLPCL